ncbi:MAG: protein kinase [Verrucomicrobiaceae bacterium]|nr:protein kinase [Verrucomicrobiaceae bacterium]
MTAALPTTCQTCGTAIDTARSEGVCAICLFGDALDQKVNEMFGGHELHGVIARGGMGVVYRAIQQEPRREVALKTLRGAELDSPEAQTRFRDEARTMAELEHPGILPIHQFGQQDGVLFFTMKLAAGGSLAEHTADYAGQWRKTATLIVSVTEAVQFAHEHGVLHRDIKPGNILFDEDGHSFVSDFGLAKLAENADGGMTGSAAMLGTPHYMAPEIAAHGLRAATTATDVWSLGVVLHELLAQARPFQSESVPALMREIAEREPEALAQNVPLDLRVIASKALAKDPVRRYATARALADDLRCWLEGRPILARPTPAAEKLWLWMKRSPGMAAMSALLALLFIIAAGLLLRAYERTNEALRTSLVTQAKFQRSSGRMGQRHGALATLQRAAAIRMGTDIASECAAALACVDLRERSHWSLEPVSGSQMPEFSPDLTQCAVAERSGLSLRSAVDGKVVRRFAAAHRADSFAFSPDGKAIVTRLADNTIQLWSTDGSAPVVEISSAVPYGMSAGIAASFSPAQQAWAIAAKDGAVVRVLPTGETSEWLPAEGRIPGSLRFDPQGNRLAIMYRDGIVVWQMDGGPKQLWATKLEAGLPALAWHPSGSCLAMTTQAGVREVLVMNTEDGAVRSRLRGPQQSISRIAFHPRSYVIAATSNDSMLRLWDYRDARLLLTMPATDRTLAWSADGLSLGCGYGLEKLAVFDFTDDPVLREFSGNNSFQQGVGHDINKSADGLWLLSTLRYQVQFWNTLTRTPTSYVTSPTLIYSQAFLTPDSRTLIYSELKKGGHIMRLPLDLNLTGLVSSKDHAQQVPGSENANVIDMTARGDWIVIHNDSYRIDLWPEGDAARASVLLATGSGGVAFSPDLRWAVAPSERSGGVIVFDLANRPWRKQFLISGSALVRWSPDGRWVYVRGSSENLLLDATTWQEQARWPTKSLSYGRGCNGFSPDSKRLVISVRNESLDVLSVPDLRLIVSLTPPLPLDFRSVVWSNDSTKLWAMGVAGRMFEWDLGGLQRELKKLGMEWKR